MQCDLCWEDLTKCSCFTGEEFVRHAIRLHRRELGIVEDSLNGHPPSIRVTVKCGHKDYTVIKQPKVELNSYGGIILSVEIYPKMWGKCGVDFEILQRGTVILKRTGTVSLLSSDDYIEVEWILGPDAGYRSK